MSIPRVTIIIPHFNGERILKRCLKSLHNTNYKDFRILIIDNGSTDNSITMVRTKFPEVDIIQSKKNLGYAGGCNLGIQSCESRYVVLLNNDTTVKPDWLTLLVETAEEQDSIAAVQPKILSIQQPDRFDYCGAAGGEIDIFGYPFARGRIFYTMEKDYGQYDDSREVFWATGAAVLLKKSVLDKIGLLEQDFFAHMEEIDLNWRMHLAGYKVVSQPKAVVFHQTGATLGEDKFYKMVLNHRNNLLMILRNYSCITLMWLLPVRLCLEFFTVIGFLLKIQPKRSIAVMAGFGGVMIHFTTILKGRRLVKYIRIHNDDIIFKKMYHRSIAIDYFIKKISTFKDLNL
ncbi:MAG: glycosyltransferase family 2 protein [bacterium]